MAENRPRKRKVVDCAEKLLDEAPKKIRLNWNSQPESGTLFRVCLGDKQEPRIFPNRDFNFAAENIRIFSNPAEKHFACILCSEKFKFFLSLIFHLRTIHGNSDAMIKEVRCEICQEKLTDERAKLRHINDIHYGRQGNNITHGNVGEFSKPHTLIKIRVKNLPSQKDLFAARTVRNQLIDLKVQSKVKGQLMKSQVNEECGKCLKCERPFKSYNECAYHLQKTHKKTNRKPEEPLIACSACTENEENMFKNAVQFGKHLDEFHACDFPNFRCNFCYLGFTNMLDLMNHKKGLHPTTPHYKCEDCGFKFFDKSVLDSHCLREHKSSMKACDICFKPLRTLTRQSHMKKVHNMDERGVEFPTETCNIKHKDNIRGSKLINSENPHVFGCSKCPRGPSADFKSLKAITNHLQKIHAMDDYNACLCLLCEDKMYESVHLLKKHVEKEHANQYQPHRCEFCPYGFASAFGLEKHKAVEHPEIESFSCTHCDDRIFFKQGDLDKHVKLLHNQGKRKVYACNFCNETFGGTSGLNRFKTHVKLTHGLGFKCYICGSVSNSQKAFDRHEKTHLKNAEQEDAIMEEKMLLEKRPDKIRRPKVVPKSKAKYNAEAAKKKNKTYKEKCELKKKLKEISEREEEDGGRVQAEKEALKKKLEAYKDSSRHNKERGEKDWAEWVEKLASEVAIEPAILARLRIYPERIAAVIAEREPLFSEGYTNPKLEKPSKKEKARDARVSCTICNMSLSGRKDLKRHISGAHFQLKNFVCDACGNKYNKKHDMQRHQKTCAHFLMSGLQVPAETKEKDETNDDQFKCGKCGIELQSMEQLAGHMVSSHGVNGETGSIVCPTCGLVFSNIHHMRRHQVNIHKQFDVMPFQCSECHKRFVTHISLTVHRLKSHGETPEMLGGELKCPNSKCCFSSTSQNTMKDHFKAEHDSEPYDCDKCSVKFTSDFSLIKHKSNEHPAEMSSDAVDVCSGCGKSFPQKSSFMRHIRERVCSPAENIPKHQCDICGAVYMKPSKLTEHINVKHKKIKHTCHICGAQYARITRLRSHLQLAHGAQLEGLLLACENCDLRFSNNSALKNHMNGNKCRRDQDKKRCGPNSADKKESFACEKCGRIYSHESSLKVHLKKCTSNTSDSAEYSPSVSPGSNSLKDGFQCKTCGQSFPNRRYLKDHENQEHGEDSDDEDYQDSEYESDDSNGEETISAVNSISVFV